MDEMTMTFEEAVSDYRRTAQKYGWIEYAPDQQASETMRSGGWILRDSYYQFLTVVEIDESVLIGLAGSRDWLEGAMK